MMSGASLGSAGESRARTAVQLFSPRTGTCAAAPGWGQRQGRIPVPLCCEPNKAIRFLLLLEGRTIRLSFHFYTCISCLVYAKV